MRWDIACYRGGEEVFLYFRAFRFWLGESRDVGRREIEDFQKEEEEEEEGGGDSRTGSDWSRGGEGGALVLNIADGGFFQEKEKGELNLDWRGSSANQKWEEGGEKEGRDVELFGPWFKMNSQIGYTGMCDISHCL